MKTKISRISKSTLSVILAIMMIFSTVLVGMVSVNAAAANTSIYYYRPDADTSNWYNVSIHHWIDGGTSSGWPGDSMDFINVDNSGNYFHKNIDSDHNECMFTNGTTNDTKKTDELSIPSGAKTKPYIYKNGVFSEVKLYLVGTINGENLWGSNHYPLTYSNGTWSITIDLNSGDEIKVRLGDTTGAFDDWDVAYGGENKSNFKIAATGKHKISIADGKNAGDNATKLNDELLPEYPISGVAKYTTDGTNYTNELPGANVSVPSTGTSDGVDISTTEVEGYVFDKWVASGGTVENATSLNAKFKPTQRDASVTAQYKKKHKVTISSNSNGTATVSKNEVVAGESYKITATPNDNYRVGSVTIDDAEQLDSTVSTSTNSGKYTKDVTPADDDSVKVGFVYCYRIFGTLAESAGIDKNDAADWNYTNFDSALPLTQVDKDGNYYMTVTLTPDDINGGKNYFKVITPEEKYGAWTENYDITTNSKEDGGYGSKDDDNAPAFVIPRAGTYNIYVAKGTTGTPNLWVTTEATPTKNYYFSINDANTYDLMTEKDGKYIYEVSRDTDKWNIDNKFKITDRNHTETQTPPGDANTDQHCVNYNIDKSAVTFSPSMGDTKATINQEWKDIILSDIPSEANDLVIEYTPATTTDGKPSGTIKVWTKNDYYGIYTVTCGSVTNGTLSVEGGPTFAKDTTVTVLPAPNTGYVVDKVTYTPAGGSATTITADSNGKYKFTMPAANVTVNATFKKGSTGTPTDLTVMYVAGDSNSNPSSWASNDSKSVPVYKNADGSFYADLPVTADTSYYFAAIDSGGAYTDMLWKGGNNNDVTITITNATSEMLTQVNTPNYWIGSTKYNFGHFHAEHTTTTVRVSFASKEAKAYTVAGSAGSGGSGGDPAAETVTIYAKDGTIRQETNNGNKTYKTTGDFAETEIVTVDGVPSVTDSGEYQKASVEKGSSVTVTTTVDAAHKAVYYVRGWCVNGAYSFGLNTTVKTDGVYTGTLRIPEEYKGDKIEITPVFFFADADEAVTFVVEGFDETIQKVWGNTCAAYAYYTGAAANTEMLGAYPGQPMLNINGRLTIQIPKKDAAGLKIKGITLNNYNFDDKHKDIWGDKGNCQTYDYDDFIRIIEDKSGVQQIVFNFKYRTSETNKENNVEVGNIPPTSLPTSDESKFANGWEYLTDYQGNKVNIFGKKLSGTAIEDNASYVKIVSDGYAGSYIGDYATKWTIYDKDGTKIATLPCSALLAETQSQVYKDEDEDYQVEYAELLKNNLQDYPAMITYESSITGGSQQGNRCDGRWYYSTNDDYIQSNIIIQHSEDNGDTWVLDPFTATDSNTGTTSGSSAYFTNTAFEGKTNSGSIPYSSTNSFTFKADAQGDYAFVGWYRLKDGTITEITTTDPVASSAMTSSDTFIARFKKVTSGYLNINHTLDTNYQGSGKTYLTVKITDENSNDIYNSGEVTALPEAIGTRYISSDHPTYTITVTLHTVTTGKDTFNAFVLDKTNNPTYVTDAKFFTNATTSGDGTGDVTRTITFKVGDLFENSVQKVTSINYKSQINKTVYKYSVTYTYPSRLYGNQSYNVAGEFSTEYLEKYVDTTGNTIKNREFFNVIAPYEDNFKTTIAWDIDNATIDYQDANPSGGIATNTFYCTVGVKESKTETAKCLFNLPYEYNTGDYSAVVDTDGNVVAADSASFTLTTNLFKNYLVTVNGKKDYITAPAVIYENGTARYFKYWEVKETPSSSTLLTKCYSLSYNLAAYCDVSVTPVYGDENSSGFGGEATSASIVYLGDSRNQWNNCTDKSAPWTSADRLYADFALAFSYDDKLLNEYAGTTDVETGIVIQNPGTLKANSTGGMNTDNAYYQNIYKNTENIGIVEFIKNKTQPSGGGKCVKQEIALTDLSNKNRAEYYYGLPNLVNETTTETKVRTYVFRAYAYIKVGDKVTLSDPVYFNMYTTATK